MKVNMTRAHTTDVIGHLVLSGLKCMYHVPQFGDCFMNLGTVVKSGPHRHMHMCSNTICSTSETQNNTNGPYSHCNSNIATFQAGPSLPKQAGRGACTSFSMRAESFRRHCTSSWISSAIGVIGADAHLAYHRKMAFAQAHCRACVISKIGLSLRARAGAWD